MITVACFVRSAISVCMRSEPSTSLGFGGTLPAASTSRLFDFGVRCSTSASAARPASTSLRPAPPGRPIVFATIERRRSPSTSTTVVPAAARVSARLHAIGGLAVAGQRARDDDGLRRVVDVHELQVRAQRAQRLGDRERAALAVCSEPTGRRAGSRRRGRARSGSCRRRRRRSSARRRRPCGCGGRTPCGSWRTRCRIRSRAGRRRCMAVCTSGKVGVVGRDAESPAITVTGAEPSVPSPSIESISTIIAWIHASARSRAPSGVSRFGADLHDDGVGGVRDGHLCDERLGRGLELEIVDRVLGHGAPSRDVEVRLHARPRQSCRRAWTCRRPRSAWTTT